MLRRCLGVSSRWAIIIDLAVLVLAVVGMVDLWLWPTHACLAVILP